MKRGCWAQPLGNCSDKMSNEHIVTGGLFDGKVVVQGLPWCPEPKEIGLANLTAKLLCTKHNSELSDVDSAAINVKQAYEDAITLMNLRQNLKKRMWAMRRVSVDGWLLERWFLKTLINIAHCGDTGFPVGPDVASGMLSTRMLEIAFGIQRFVKPEGLYTVSVVGQKDTIDSRVNIITLTKSGHVGGTLFRFGSLNYHLHLERDGLPAMESFAPHLQKQIQGAVFTHHLRRSNFQVHGRASHSIDFKW